MSGRNRRQPRSICENAATHCEAWDDEELEQVPVVPEGTRLGSSPGVYGPRGHEGERPVRSLEPLIWEEKPDQE
jgi:hypothetical protein